MPQVPQWKWHQTTGLVTISLPLTPAYTAQALSPDVTTGIGVKAALSAAAMKDSWQYLLLFFNLNTKFGVGQRVCVWLAGSTLHDQTFAAREVGKDST